MTRASWWQANRWWLLVLPLVTVLMVGASSYRIEEFWWQRGQHHEVATVAPGEFGSVNFDSSLSGHTRTFKVRLAGELTRSEELPDLYAIDNDALPEGMVVGEVSLDFEADPDQSLRGCEVSFVGSDGVVYGAASDPLSQGFLCVPEDTPGPYTDDTPTDTPERPTTWSTTAQGLIPADAEITEIRVWWNYPEYVTLQVQN